LIGASTPGPSCFSRDGSKSRLDEPHDSADERIQFNCGGPVLVTDKGAEALFKREHGMVSIV